MKDERKSGADTENIEPRGANSIKYQTEPGALIYSFLFSI